MLDQSNMFTVIMAGGIGSRFWLMSTPAKPKQFLDILNEGAAMIQQTVKRASVVCPTENILVVTSLNYINLVKE